MRLWMLSLLLGGCVREGDLVPIEVSPRLAARMSYVGSLPSRTHAAAGAKPQQDAQAEEQSEEQEEEQTEAPPAKSLAADGGAD